jgi:adenylate kinase
MNFIFLGPPGAGKGTMASRAARDRSIPQISTGELFREAIKNGTELGKQVQSIIAQGGLVPDDVTVALVRERLTQPDAARGFILDGFPRTIPQAEALGSMTRIDRAIDFSLSDDEVIRRLSGRRVCRTCGRNYHVLFLPPKTEGVCDACGGELYTRDDDTVESIRTRLEVYKRQTAPLIEFYSVRGLLVSVDASAAPDQVYEQLKPLLGP